MTSIRHFVLVFAVFLFALGCDRLKVQNSTISLQIPHSLSGKLSASGSMLKLKQLSIQVTAVDMSQPIVSLQELGGAADLTSEVTLEVPAGANRLVQVLAAYSPVGSDGGVVLYYGDVTKSFSGASEVVDVSLSKLGGENLIEGRLTGRYLSSASSGPSGELKLHYRPAGKPSLMAGSTMMFGGWFDAAVFNNIPLDYVLPDGTFLGEQWTTESLAVSPHLIRINKPLSYLQDWSGPGAVIWKTQSPRVIFYGFFAKDKSLVSDKTVCVQAKTFSGGTLFSGSDYLTMNQNNPIPLVHFPVGTVPENFSRKMSFIGGRDISACNNLSLNEEFKSYLRFSADTWSNRIYGAQYNTSIRGLHTFYSLPGYRYSYRNEFQLGVEEGKVYLEFKPLPGALEGLDGYQFYTRSVPTSYMGTVEDICEIEYLKRNNWTIFHTMPLGVLNNEILRVSLEGLLPNSGQENILCLSKGGRPYGYPLFVFYPPTSMLPSTLNLSLGSSETGLSTSQILLTDECRPVDVTLDGIMIVGNPLSDLNYTIAAVNQDSSPAPILYAAKDCAGEAVAELTKDFSKNAIMSSVFVKSVSSGSFQLTTTNNKGLNSSGAFTVYVTAPQNTPTSSNIFLDIGANSFPPLYSLPSEGCYPIAAAFYSNDGTVSNANGSANISWIDGDGITSYAPPSDVKIVDNCISKTPLSTTVTVTEGVARFAIDIGISLLSNVFFRVEGFSVSYRSEVNISPLAHQLVLSSSAHNIPDVNPCIPVKVEARDKAGNLATVPSSKKLSFSLNTRLAELNSGGPGLTYYSDNLCENYIPSLAIDGGLSSTTFYIKSSSPDSFYLNYNSSHVEIYSSWNTQELYFTPALSP